MLNSHTWNVKFSFLLVGSYDNQPGQMVEVSIPHLSSSKTSSRNFDERSPARSALKLSCSLFEHLELIQLVKASTQEPMLLQKFFKKYEVTIPYLKSSAWWGSGDTRGTPLCALSSATPFIIRWAVLSSCVYSATGIDPAALNLALLIRGSGSNISEVCSDHKYQLPLCNTDHKYTQIINISYLFQCIHDFIAFSERASSLRSRI